jgi:hypothetical protein
MLNREWRNGKNMSPAKAGSGFNANHDPSPEGLGYFSFVR